MRIISLDPSLRSFGIFTNEDGATFSEVIQREEKDRIEVLKWFCLHFAAEAAKKWDLMIVEGYAFNAGSKWIGPDGKVKARSSSITVQAEVGGLVRGLFAARGVPIIEVPIGTWKSVTGISMKKGTTQYESDYLNEVAIKYKVRFETTDEADAFLFYQTVKLSCTQNHPAVGTAKIRAQIEALKIDPRKL